MKKVVFALLCFLSIISIRAQIVSGPMLGTVEIREAKIWLEVAPTVKNIQLVYNKVGDAKTKALNYKGQLGQEFNPITFSIGGLDMNSTYHYHFIVDGKKVKQNGYFTTKDLWQWRKPAPDFTFITGSCSYVNEPVYDRPGKPYGGDSSIFESMAKEKSAFMLWLGDNWYTREVDFSKWGLWYRAHYDRSRPVLQNLLKAMPHYATWDDHDYGPNDIGSNFILKEESKKIFDSYWANPSSGYKGEGIYTQFSYSDADFFVLDDRWWRASDLKDSVDGKPNADKSFLGRQQMEWLKNSLRYSTATFKFIVIGTQVLNRHSNYDKMMHFPAEHQELLNFIADNKIEGVLFLTGDRHHSEVIKMERPGQYTLYDLTVSPLTSGVSKFNGPEKNNPNRVVGVEAQNYGRFNFTGPKGQRKLSVEFLGIKGEKLGEWSITESQLKY